MGAVPGVKARVKRSTEAAGGTDFSALYRRHGRHLHGTALRMLRRPEDAEDAVQEAFLTYYNRGAGVDPEQAGGWLKRVLVNRCIDRLRQRKRRPQGALEEVPPEPPRQRGPGIDLRRAVARLPERARLVFVLHDVEGFRHKEVADLLGVSEGGSKSQLFRALDEVELQAPGRKI